MWRKRRLGDHAPTRNLHKAIRAGRNCTNGKKKTIRGGRLTARARISKKEQAKQRQPGRRWQRDRAYLGEDGCGRWRRKFTGAEVSFQPVEDVPSGGVLLALPALSCKTVYWLTAATLFDARGLLPAAKQSPAACSSWPGTHCQTGGLDDTRPPCEWGKLMGLDTHPNG